MTPDQIRIVEWLKEEVPTLYPAFEKAVQLMEGGDFPGRSNLVCHACRDICTVIQQYLWTLKLLPILLQGFESEMRAGSLKVAAAFVSVVQRDAAMAEFSL
jgi:hypothetical protein